MSKPKKPLNGPLNPTSEELAALPMGATVYFDVIPGETFWVPLPTPELQRKRLENLACVVWLSDFKVGRERFVLLPGEDGEPSGAPISVTSQRFKDWLAARYKKAHHEEVDPESLRSFVKGADFQMFLGEMETRRRSRS